MRDSHAEDDAVNAAVKDLKERGFRSPYLRAFVVARINPPTTLQTWRQGAVRRHDRQDVEGRSALRCREIPTWPTREQWRADR